MTVADTSFLIDVMRGSGPAVQFAERLHERGESVWVPAPVLHELHYGARRSRDPAAESRRLEHLVRSLPVLPLDAESARLAGTLEADLEKRGRRPNRTDVQIAAIALARGESVTTADGAFPRAPGLRLETYPFLPRSRVPAKKRLAQIEADRDDSWEDA